MIPNKQGTKDEGGKEGKKDKGKTKIRIVIGLGNPDPNLLGTYHNAGTIALPALAARLAPDAPQPLAFKHYKGIFEYAPAGAFMFVKSLTYMNESGKAVKEALRVLKAKPREIAVAHDDSDLTIGNFKIAFGGGAAGHNGIRSIVAHLGTEDFTRIRIGIRDANEVQRKKAGDFVLSPIGKANMKKLETVFGEIAEKLS
ncbi:MAG: aminoacyl-tRNA hydrolase [Candidatus Pacebacteria bacterium]|nr:aminoacyl-tRNA hydrolase [Candidatus Paceibacterota bacterium]